MEEKETDGSDRHVHNVFVCLWYVGEHTTCTPTRKTPCDTYYERVAAVSIYTYLLYIYFVCVYMLSVR